MPESSVTTSYNARQFCLIFFLFFCLNGFSPWNTRAVHDRYDGNGNWLPWRSELSGDEAHSMMPLQFDMHSSFSAAEKPL